MKSPICEMLDIEFPLVAFSHCRDVVVAVSKAGFCRESFDRVRGRKPP